MTGSRSHKNSYTVGLISDTHGLLRPEAITALEGSDMIIHAGDIGSPRVIDELEAIAPVVAVRGNMDNEGWSYTLKRSEVVELNGQMLYVIHNVGMLDIDPSAANIRAVIYGHSHRPAVNKEGGLLYINPGSAGPRRFRLPVSVALLHIKGKKFDAQIIELKV